VVRSPIILALGNTNGSIEGLDLETILPLIVLSTFCFNQVNGLRVSSSIPLPKYKLVST